MLAYQVRLMKLLAGGSGVVCLYGSYEDAVHITLVMEYCQAGDLFKTMLMHGGVLDEHWVASQVYYAVTLERIFSYRPIFSDVEPDKNSGLDV